jgi:hypothetical protein
LCVFIYATTFISRLQALGTRLENETRIFPHVRELSAYPLIDWNQGELESDPNKTKWECFDADTKKDLAVEVREYYIPNFSNWKDHDVFEAEFAKLLYDLRATEI